MICLSKNELTVRVNIDALLGASLLASCGQWTSFTWPVDMPVIKLYDCIIKTRNILKKDKCRRFSFLLELFWSNNWEYT